MTDVSSALAIRILQSQEMMKQHLGDEYDEKMEHVRVLVKGCMKHRNWSATRAALELSKAMHEGGAPAISVVRILAAAADVIQEEEPKEEKTKA